MPTEGNGNGNPTDQVLLREEVERYLREHPEFAERLRKAERAYGIFGRYLTLTQTRTIIRESAASNAEGELNATLSRVDT